MQIKFTPIIPQALNVRAMELELLQGLKDLGEEIRENFEDTTRTWDHQTAFGPNPNVPVVSGDIARVETSTEDIIYKYVSDGTKSHPIFPRRAKALRFPGTFTPKTFPGIVGSGQGFSGPPIEHRNWVAHPGVEARKFDDEIRDRQNKNALVYLTNAMKLARRASGHAYP